MVADGICEMWKCPCSSVWYAKTFHGHPVNGGQLSICRCQLSCPCRNCSWPFQNWLASFPPFTWALLKCYCIHTLQYMPWRKKKHVYVSYMSSYTGQQAAKKMIGGGRTNPDRRMLKNMQGRRSIPPPIYFVSFDYCYEQGALSSYPLSTKCCRHPLLIRRWVLHWKVFEEDRSE